jgi:hypothetical protein
LRANLKIPKKKIITSLKLQKKKLAWLTMGLKNDSFLDKKMESLDSFKEKKPKK